MLSQNFIFGEGKFAKAIFTNLNPGLKRSYTQISGNKNLNPTPMKKPKLSLPTKVGESSPLKRGNNEIHGRLSHHDLEEKRFVFSMPKSQMGNLDLSDPNSWITTGRNLSGEEIAVYSSKIPIVKFESRSGDVTYSVTENSGIVKSVTLVGGGDGWIRNRDIIWTND